MQTKWYGAIAGSVFFCVSALTQIAWADPTGPVTIELPPEGQGDAFVPGTRLVENLPAAYIEEEFFISGAATLYNYAHNPPLSPTDTTAI